MKKGKASEKQRRLIQALEKATGTKGVTVACKPLDPKVEKAFDTYIKKVRDAQKRTKHSKLQVRCLAARRRVVC